MNQHERSLKLFIRNKSALYSITKQFPQRIFSQVVLLGVNDSKSIFLTTSKNLPMTTLEIYHDKTHMLSNITGIFMWLSKTKSMTFERSKTVLNILVRCPIASDDINSLCDFFDFVENLWNQTQTQKVLISSETMGHRMRVFDTVLERPKVILLVFESHMKIPVMLGNIWSTSVDLIVD